MWTWSVCWAEEERVGSTRFRDGAITIEMDDTLARIARRAVRQASPLVVDGIDEATQAIHADAYRSWPVLTGRSHAGLRQSLVLGTSSVEGLIHTVVDYTFYIRPREFYGAATAWAEWVQKPMRKAATVLVRTLGPELVRSLESG